MRWVVGLGGLEELAPKKCSECASDRCRWDKGESERIDRITRKRSVDNIAIGGSK